MVDCSHESSYYSDTTDHGGYGGDGGMQSWLHCNADVDGDYNDKGKGSTSVEHRIEIMAKTKMNGNSGGDGGGENKINDSGGGVS